MAQLKDGSRGIWFLSFGYLLLHIFYGALVTSSHRVDLQDALNHWDSGWYTLIIDEGYEGPRFAFYPLYPLLTLFFKKLVTTLILNPIGVGPFPTPIFGSILSTFCFLGATYLVSQWQRSKSLFRSDLDGGVSFWGWFLVVLSPASYVFHTHHTESLYLLLSVAAYTYTMRGSWILGSLMGGMCALTKNQGIFVAISVGIASALVKDGSVTSERLRRFFISGLISGALFFLYPLYCYFKSGDFWAFYNAQMHWRPEMSDHSYWRAFFFANPWQNTNTGSLVRYGWFWLVTIGALGLLCQRKIVYGVYSILFVAVMPLSGEFVGTFRYSSVLFPVWFFLGKGLGALQGRLFYGVFLLVFLALSYLNLTTYRAYLLARWSY